MPGHFDRLPGSWRGGVRSPAKYLLTGVAFLLLGPGERVSLSFNRLSMCVRIQLLLLCVAFVFIWVPRWVKNRKTLTRRLHTGVNVCGKSKKEEDGFDRR